MKTLMQRTLTRLRQSTAALALVVAAAGAYAAPGAHGPNGEHLDEKTSAAAGALWPRLEARSDMFELVAQLKGGELTIFIDRYETNEPLLGAKLDVESGSLKATASFRAEAGDYAVSDAALLKAIATPGEHPLVFTLVAGQETDLLDGTLITPGNWAAGSDHGHAQGGGRIAAIGVAAIGVAAIGLAAAGLFAWRRRRRVVPAAATAIRGA